MPVCAVMLLGTAPAWADGGDFSIDFAAADPTTYNHAEGGGSWSEGFVTSLQGGDFQAGDIVSWLARITVRPGAAEQTIELNLSFAGVNTGHPGAGLTNLVRVAFTDGSEDLATLISSSSNGPLSPGDEILNCSVRIGGLADEEQVVIRIDTLLFLAPDEHPTGNLWGRLDSAYTIVDDKEADTISTGKQTVPFQKVSEIAPLAIGVVKKVSLSDVTVTTWTELEALADHLTVRPNADIIYWFGVKNLGASTLGDVSLNDVCVDEVGTPITGSTPSPVSLSKVDLSAGDFAIGHLDSNVGSTLGSLYDKAIATGEDGMGRTYEGTATASVVVENTNPVAVKDEYSTDEDVQLIVPAPGVLTNDSDADGDALTVTGNTQPAHAAVPVTVAADGSFTYTPTADWHGTDTFEYTISDVHGAAASATVTITVNSVNDTPVAADDSYSMYQGTTLAVAAPGILGNDTDVDGDTLSAILIDAPSSGTLNLDSNGSFTYEPTEAGTVTFTYKASDGPLQSNIVTVTIIVHPLTFNDRNVSVVLAGQTLTYVSTSRSLTGSFTITNDSGPGQPVKVLGFSLAVQYNDGSGWSTVPSEQITGLTFTPAASVDSIANEAGVTVSFDGTLAEGAVPAGAAIRVNLGTQIEGLPIEGE